MAPTLENLIEAVDSNEVAAPYAQIATTDTMPVKAFFNPEQTPWPDHKMQKFVALAPKASRYPEGSRAIEQVNCATGHLAREVFTQQDPTAIDETSRLGQTRMLLNKRPVRNAVAVKKNKVVTGRKAGGHVAGTRRGKPDIRVPDVAYWTSERGALLVKSVHLIGSGAIVRDQHLV